jgi:hypothetical protein
VSALRAAFRRWNLPLYLLILAGAAAVYVYRQRGIPGLELLPAILPAVGLYLLSHAVRSLRLALIVSHRRFAIADATAVQFMACAVGNIAPPLVKEAAYVWLFDWRVPGELPRIIIAVIYSRLFDFVALLPLVALLHSSAPFERQLLTTILVVAILATLTALLMLPKLCDAGIQYFLKHAHTRRAVAAVAVMASTKRIVRTLKLVRSERVFLILVLTGVAWAFELLSVYFVLQQLQPSDASGAFRVAIANIASGLPILDSPTTPTTTVYGPSYAALTILALALLPLYWRRRA